ncbi:MAG: ImmA/IrrE family metallo-endopeptidase [Salana multivorans]|uniref:ImmA/IrrE family metallo-endopeptidase n=1 Tax=Salana multivorans TaxID=120377 RepID=UPI00096346D2|nr:ImmA/IrrE family metallo-endopeptidase [Salana multivorans]MBN8883005.1 ImmA/IrrE family metallo-endopeptidase [Salana multivorans]OJX94043.1 MAG: hypothetical protein BGO96_09560 [Micrococcales bacterium 73-15]
MTNPWRRLRELAHITLHWTLLPADRLGESDGDCTIWMDKRQRQVQRRCTLMHEIIHLERGDVDGCADRGEVDVEREAARRLIPIEDLLDKVRWTHDLAELADELWVDEDMLHARLDGLSARERMLLVALWESGEYAA